jgi:hypothetical protein
MYITHSEYTHISRSAKTGRQASRHCRDHHWAMPPQYGHKKKYLK